MLNKNNVKINDNFYDVERESLLLFKDLNERLSCNFLNYDIPDSVFIKEITTFLIKNFYGIFNFITKEFSPNINVNLHSYASFCSITENKIQLGVELLLLKDISQQKKVDSIYAVMLHEMLHKRYTNYDILINLFPEEFTLENLYSKTKNANEILLKTLSNETNKSIFNILEDRRIERLGLQEFPGYVFYFDQLRSLVFFLHLQREHEINIDIFMNYLLYSILLPELKSVYFDHIIDKFSMGTFKITKKEFLDFTLKLDKYIITNETLVYSDLFTDLIKATNDIYNFFPPHINKQINKQYNIGPLSDLNEIKDLNKSNENFQELEKHISELLENIEKEYVESYNRNIEKPRIEKINIINCASDVYNTVSIYQPKCNLINTKIYNQSKKISSDIARNLGFISSRLNAHNQEFELNEGEIDEDELYSISYSSDIFYTEEIKPGFSFDLGILIDESGSMSGIKKFNAIVAALGCILGTKDHNHINLFVYGHSNNRHDDVVELYEYFNKNRGVSDWKNIFAVSSNGGNADGYAIAKMGEIMIEDSNNKNKILIVISDGYPAAKNYSGHLAEEHVKKVVDLLDNKGIEIVQICIDNISSSPKMFKNYIPFDNIGNFINKFKNFLQTKLIKFSEEI